MPYHGKGTHLRRFRDQVQDGCAASRVAAPSFGGSRCVSRYALVDRETARALYGERGFNDIPAHHFKPVLRAYFLKAEFQCVPATSNGRCGKHQALACASKVAASLTSNLPGPSTFKVATLPSLTSME